jgi:hypothetical protein
MSVLHHCDNPPCCNPAHLFLGTQADNVFDMVAKKRRRGPSREAIRRWSSKLTPEQARQIRLELAKGVPQRIVAERYGVSQATISNVNNGGTWPESGGPMRSRVDQRGERASHVKLTEADVREIRLRREPVKAQAARYGVSVPNIEAILYGRTWKHLL